MTTKLLTVREVAHQFRVSPQSVARWEKAGDLRSVRIGRSVRFTQQSLRDFVTAHDSARDREDAEMVQR